MNFTHFLFKSSFHGLSLTRFSTLVRAVKVLFLRSDLEGIINKAEGQDCLFTWYEELRQSTSSYFRLWFCGLRDVLNMTEGPKDDVGRKAK